MSYFKKQFNQCHNTHLIILFIGYEFEALMVAHDGVASMLPADSVSSVTPTLDILPQSISNRRYGEENIKIIRIEKSTEPLGATVKNEGDAVVIGKYIQQQTFRVC